LGKNKKISSEDETVVSFWVSSKLLWTTAFTRICKLHLIPHKRQKCHLFMELSPRRKFLHIRFMHWLLESNLKSEKDGSCLPKC
jgi:hypothetical protein